MVELANKMDDLHTSFMDDYRMWRLLMDRLNVQIATKCNEVMPPRSPSEKARKFEYDEFCVDYMNISAKLKAKLKEELDRVCDPDEEDDMDDEERRIENEVLNEEVMLGTLRVLTTAKVYSTLFGKYCIGLGETMAAMKRGVLMGEVGGVQA